MIQKGKKEKTMSRYFTSPPPVYSRNGQNLVESTKMESHIIASKKVHRKEKKDRKKLKNEKSIKQSLYIPIKQVFDECEQLEKSCLTEEHHHLVYLSDGSQNSNKKRRREASPSVESSNIKATPVAGKPLRIRFVFKKPEVVVPQLPLEDCVPSPSGTDRHNEISSSLDSDKTAIITESKKKKKHRTSKESRYNSLFDEPVVPSISMEEYDGWLLDAKRQENVSTKSTMNEEDVVMNMHKLEESCFPRSQLLSEVGVFSLPYTVLF